MNEDAFLSALHDSPNDEVTWLALADWLEESDQPERAELVRLVRWLRTVPVMRRTRKRAGLEDRVAALLAAGVRPVVPELVNSLGMRLALIPPGHFRMGSPEIEIGRDDDEKIRAVTLTRAFYLGVFPVTQRQYERVMDANPSSFRPAGNSGYAVEGLDTSDFPAEMMTWDDAMAFCQLLNEREKRSPPGLVYRLPTDAEWEYGCRGGTASTSAFPGGASLSSTQANFKGDEPYGGAPEGPYLGGRAWSGRIAPMRSGCTTPPATSSSGATTGLGRSRRWSIRRGQRPARCGYCAAAAASTQPDTAARRCVAARSRTTPAASSASAWRWGRGCRTVCESQSRSSSSRFFLRTRSSIGRSSGRSSTPFFLRRTSIGLSSSSSSGRRVTPSSSSSSRNGGAGGRPRLHRGGRAGPIVLVAVVLPEAVVLAAELLIVLAGLLGRRRRRRRGVPSPAGIVITKMMIEKTMAISAEAKKVRRRPPMAQQPSPT